MTSDSFSDLFRFICTFLTKAACCRNIEIVLHPTILSYIYIYIYTASNGLRRYIYMYIYLRRPLDAVYI